MKRGVLTVNNLTLAFEENTEVLTAVSFSLYKGEVLGIVGESGSGKSLTARAIVGLLPNNCYRSSGSIQLEDTELTTLSDDELCTIRGRRIGLVFQDPLSCFNPLHRIGKQIGEGLAIHQQVTQKEIDTRVSELMHLTGLTDTTRLMNSFPHQLSGGQRQRAMVAMMLAAGPDILIADEPTTALDAIIQQQVLDLLNSLKKSMSLSMILISHDLAMVRQVADRIVVMQNGCIVERGACEEVFHNPQHSYTRSLLRRDTGRAQKTGGDNEPVVLSVKDFNIFYPQGQALLPWKKPAQLNAVKNVSFELRRGECLGIVGESGSGKSSLGLGISALIPSRGKVSVHGEDISKMSKEALKKLRANLQIVFQDPLAALNPRLSVEECIAEGLKAQKKFSQQEISIKVTGAMEAVELDPAMRHRYPHEFSGGQCQRICLARALILEPACIIFDEPTSSLDRNTQFQVLDLLRRLQKKYGLASIFITHDLGLVESLCGRVMIMHNGEIVEKGTTEDIFSTPTHSYTRELLKAAMVGEVM
ncbi:MAG: microcin ABC transporter ATP-binding protein [Desulfobacterales bacterium]|nr:MAG: microcin ABC transporter ATP-binding protein [Desulfobacterales bacterium]